MSKILFIGDPHLKVTRFDLAMRFLSWLNQLIKEQKPDIVVNLGDTFDTHAVLRSEVMTEFMKHVYSTIDQGIEYVYLVGNHDMYKPNDPKYHAMLPYKNKIKGLHVIDEIQNLFGMTFVPYQHDGAKFPRKTLPICVAHQTFLGADYGPIRATEGVDATSIEGCELIVSGHIHTKSVLGSVLYVGSPFSQSASDVDQVKGITILEDSTLHTTFHQCPLPMWRKLKLDLLEGGSVASIHSDLATAVAGSKDHWVIDVSGPKPEVTSYLSSKDFKEAVKDVDVKVRTTFTDKEKKKVSIEAKSMEHIISEYAVKIYSGNINKDELIERAKAILSEARAAR